MRFIGVIALLVIGMSGANAQVVGLGAKSCAQFAQEYLEAPEIAEPLYFTYAQGYMSALNILMRALKNPIYDLAAWPVSRQEASLRNFCDRNPSAEFVFAVQNLLEALPQIPPQSN